MSRHLARDLWERTEAAVLTELAPGTGTNPSQPERQEAPRSAGTPYRACSYTAMGLGGLEPPTSRLSGPKLAPASAGGYWHRHCHRVPVC